MKTFNAIPYHIVGVLIFFLFFIWFHLTVLLFCFVFWWMILNQPLPHQSCYSLDLFCWPLHKRLVLQEKEETWLARQQFNGIVSRPAINQLLWLNGISSKSCVPPPHPQINNCWGFLSFCRGGVFKIKGKQGQNFRRANDPKAGGEKQITLPAGWMRGERSRWAAGQKSRGGGRRDGWTDGRDLYLGLRTKAPGESLGR